MVEGAKSRSASGSPGVCTAFEVGERVMYRTPVACGCGCCGDVVLLWRPAVVVAGGVDACHRYVVGPDLPGRVMMHTARLRRRGWRSMN